MAYLRQVVNLRARRNASIAEIDKRIDVAKSIVHLYMGKNTHIKSY